MNQDVRNYKILNTNINESIKSNTGYKFKYKTHIYSGRGDRTSSPPMEGVSDGYGRLHVYRKGDFAFFYLDSICVLCITRMYYRNHDHHFPKSHFLLYLSFWPMNILAFRMEFPQRSVRGLSLEQIVSQLSCQ